METLTARSHPLRASLSEEMHVRRLPRLTPPCRLLQIVTVLGETAASEARAHIEPIAARHRVALPPDAKYAVLPMGEMTLVWERHTEFASYTLIRHGPFDTPFDPEWFAPFSNEIIATMPGEVIRATQIALLPVDAPVPDKTAWSGWFEDEALILCEVLDGKARIMSDFRLHDDGFGRLLVIDQGLSRDEPAQLVSRLQELGNYRNMALLGLPLAQRLTPDVSRLERRLAALTHAVSERGAQDDQLLDELTFLSAELARLIAETRYRMSATRAYAQVSTERLGSLYVGAVKGYQTLGDFTERRLMPAVRTCDSFSHRLDDLSQRTAWTSALLRTRIDTALAMQNRDLLTSMNKRTQLQLRLQQTVEGLSVVAISYYLVALLSYVFALVPGVQPKVAAGISVPIVIAIVWLLVHRLRAKLVED